MVDGVFMLAVWPLLLSDFVLSCRSTMLTIVCTSIVRWGDMGVGVFDSEISEVGKFTISAELLNQLTGASRLL